MRRLDAAGDRGAALAEYAELRSRLVTRLRTGPSSETQALADALREGVASTPSAFPVRLLRADRAAFVGREAELARIDLAWRRVAAGNGPAQVVLLAAEAGIGESRLAARFAAEAGAAGATVLYGACEEQSLVPTSRSPRRSAARRPSGKRSRRDSLLPRPPVRLVLVLDDLHLADRNTLALLARVARGAAATGCWCSARTATPTPSERRSSPRSPTCAVTATSSAWRSRVSPSARSPPCSTAPPTRTASTTGRTGTRSSSASSRDISSSAAMRRATCPTVSATSCWPASRGSRPAAPRC